MKTEYYKCIGQSYSYYYRIRNKRTADQSIHTENYKGTEVVTETIYTAYNRIQLYVSSTGSMLDKPIKCTKKEWDTKLQEFKKFAKNFK